MRKTLLAVGLALLTVPALPTIAHANPIENACLRSDRPQATRAMCRCVGSVAQRTLTRSEQRRAATFFRDPQRAQDVRMSRTTADRNFWARYRAFGEAAEMTCRTG
ncbi:MAG: hypothetical protein ACXIU7_03945 [Roseinatronobacter sp.]